MQARGKKGKKGKAVAPSRSIKIESQETLNQTSGNQSNQFTSANKRVSFDRGQEPLN